MPKIAKELTALEVGRLKVEGLHAVGGVAGLHLQVTSTGARSWILRAKIGAKRRDIGLGAYPGVTLAQAREKARDARQAIAEGRDPVAERAAARSALAAAHGAEITFDECVVKFIDAKSAEWKNPKSAAQWSASLTTYASPTIGSLQVRDVELAHILKILEPVWTTKTETATRVRGRIENVLDWATVRGFRKGDNPARWRGHLDKLLAKPSKVAKVEHHTALPIDAMWAFMESLQKREGLAARALEFLILTAVRSGEVRGATWDEVDLQSRVWTIPAERMKGGKEHRVPLSDRALELLKALPRLADSNLVFPAPRGGQMSDMTLLAVMRRMNVDAVPHGFRSTFRDWAAERTNYPRDVAEMALAHTIGDKVEAAYRRGDLFEKRARLMADWAKFCALKSPEGAVIPLHPESVSTKVEWNRFPHEKQ
ncbi:site-specific integrase [Thauera sp.]|uniref:tyrosine-type recombinase/integrase n=1 Tax=Thauera sp. TaxID=1905334 RepID=UPI001B4D36D2|nr:site-specific integrase [Thauera sp.]MBP6130893.1 integrase arm-type DNA-binding domain-containing protein [Thauera sp.]MBP7046906.1 integrase arm-type DNA-binding domain-containing protein [Thauera sp.]